VTRNQGLVGGGLDLGRRELLVGGTALGVAGLVLPRHLRAQEPKKGGRFRHGKAHGSTTDTLDPATSTNDFTIGWAYVFNNFLTEVAVDGTIQGELAESFEASPDATVWTFRLRPGLEFHNGKTVTAADVIASFNHHRREDSTSAAKPILEPVVEIEALDDRTVRFALSGGSADFPFLVSDYHLPILPAVDDAIDWRSGIGCGPYVIESFEPGVRAFATRNPNYWKSDRAHFDEIEFLSILDAAARTNALTTGEVDAIDSVDLKTVHLLERNGAIRVHSVNGAQHYTFAMRTDMEPFRDNNIRMALKHGLDREALLQTILRGYGTVGNDQPIGQGDQFYAADLEQRTYDPDRAKFYLREAGVESLTVDLSAADAAFAGAVDAAVLYAEHAAAAGITINVVREPNDGYWSNVWLNKPWCAVYWGGRPTADWMFSTAYAAGAAWNDTFWEHERFNQLLVEARAELEQAKRREMYHEMQTIVRDEGGVVIPMFAAYVFATSDQIGHGEFASNWDMDGHKCVERWWFT
jgi:peptide/nickel transport system substrate-binding protein